MTQPLRPGTSSGSEYAEHVRDILNRVAELEAQVEEQKARSPAGPLLTRPPVVGLVALLFGAVLTWNYLTLTRDVEPLPPGAREASLQVSVMVLTQAVEAYREEHGTLPPSLESLGLPPGIASAVRYRPRGSDFDIIGSMGGTAVRYRSEEGPASLLEQLTAQGMDP